MQTGLMLQQRGIASKGKLAPDIVLELWSDYKLLGDVRARNMLIEHYLPLVNIVANRVGAKLPAHVDKEDLASYGKIGLIDAMTKFDLSRGLKFETYAVTRINGQIIDELRKMDWIPRSVHAQVREVVSARASLEVELQRNVTHAEIAERAGLTPEQYASVTGEHRYVKVMALDALIDTSLAIGDESLTLVSQLSDRSQDAFTTIEIEGIRDIIARAITFLSERDAIVIALYYFENKTLSDIGHLLGVTESRVCQMHTRAMMAVREKLAA